MTLPLLQKVLNHIWIEGSISKYNFSYFVGRDAKTADTAQKATICFSRREQRTLYASRNLLMS